MERKKREQPLAVHLFCEGKNFRAYEYFGAHFFQEDGQDGVLFRVWAPNAKAVSVVGDFNGWDAEKSPMDRGDGGVFTCFIPGLAEYALYKYAIFPQEGDLFLKADPYAFYAETQGQTASKVYCCENKFSWSDNRYRSYLESTSPYERPMNIYEVHLGSWKRDEQGNFLSYRALADQLIPYAKSMGYTHLELLPVMEHPYDGSWGYQVTGYYAVTARYGTPEDFMYFVNQAHRAGMGVLLDWVPAHFPKDASALANFDGTYLYEDSDPLRREHRGWGTLAFDFGRPEVRSFLISNAMFWLDTYHVDGLRVDAVAAMLYLDYDREDRQWRPNIKGGRENLEAVAFLQELNTAVLTAYPSALMMAEESTAWPLVTSPPADGGLGFHFKWNMGWMNDCLSYVATDPYFRKYEHGKLTFPLMYAFSENFIMPVSHDEVVHGKKSLLDKMPGTYEEKFAGARTFLMYQLSQPGKKLSFMGAELGQFIEWDYESGLDWCLLDYEMHRKFQQFYQDANHFYLRRKAFWEQDGGWEGFRWLNANDNHNNILSYRRIAKSGRELLFILNFAPVLREEYRIGVHARKKYREVFNSDASQYGGTGAGNPSELLPKKGEQDGELQYLEIVVPPLGAIILE